jgi:hypothetical protein
LYTSKPEYEAGGITFDCLNEMPSYVIIVYPYDIVLNSSLILKNPYYDSYTYSGFEWGITGTCSWGPMLRFGAYDDLASVNTNYLSKYIAVGEGYWTTGFTGTTQGQEPLLFSNTFRTCNSMLKYSADGTERAFAKEPYNMHGNWFRSWGLYNTMRGLYAQLTNSAGITEDSGIVDPESFTPLAYNAFYVTRMLNDGITSASQGITGNSLGLSDWFLPSHDELAFIAANTLNTSELKLNRVLLKKGQPMFGKYWTSTGTFDYNKDEGIYSGITKPNPGTVAISMNFDSAGSADQFYVYKSSRSEINKVRPIRIIRCDELYPINDKLWNLPNI